MASCPVCAATKVTDRVFFFASLHIRMAAAWTGLPLHSNLLNLTFSGTGGHTASTAEHICSVPQARMRNR